MSSVGAERERPDITELWPGLAVGDDATSLRIRRMLGHKGHATARGADRERVLGPEHVCRQLEALDWLSVDDSALGAVHDHAADATGTGGAEGERDCPRGYTEGRTGLAVHDHCIRPDISLLSRLRAEVHGRQRPLL